ncbi:MAG: LysR family transcriptional regulator [Kofleriaceae bacterium]
MDLNRAATFVRVVEAGNFTRAAEALRVPPSSVSRSVAKLETELGVVLLERTTRHVALTEAGRAYFERAREALAGLEEANSLALDAAREVHGVVRVAMPVDIGAGAGALFAPFLGSHPRIRLELTFTNRGAELVGDLVDIACAIGRLPDSSLVTRRLGNATNKLYAAPGYVKRAGQPRRIADLTRHDAIVTQAFGGGARWELMSAKGLEHVDVTARVVGEGMAFVTDAALTGLGIALLPTWLADRHVAEGKLVPILPKYSIEMPLHVLTHGSRHLPRRVVLVRDFMIAAMTKQCSTHCLPD